MAEKLHKTIMRKSIEALIEKGAKPGDIKSRSPEAFVDYANANGASWLNHEHTETGERMGGNIDIGRTTFSVKDSKGKVLNVNLNYRIDRKTGEAFYYSAIPIDAPTQLNVEELK